MLVVNPALLINLRPFDGDQARGALLIGALLAFGLGCAPTTRYVTSRNFSFQRYDNVVVSKSGEGSSTTLYGMDLELANHLASYNLRVIGNREVEGLDAPTRERTLVVRFALASNEDDTTLTISFDDYSSGRTVASFTQSQDGDIADYEDRQEILEAVTRKIIDVLVTDKGLQVQTTP